MKKNLMKLFIITLSIISLNLFNSFAIVLSVPESNGQEDFQVTGPTTIQSNESTLFGIIQVVNKYLRFSLGAVTMGVLIYGGISLITAQGNEEKMKKANKLLLGSLVGILICIFSYAVVRLIVNLFQ
ncbi:MAG: hypothetical protein WC872_03105 [Candidatus Absconditabacterales bacterium]